MHIERMADLMVSQLERICHASESTLPNVDQEPASNESKPFELHFESGLVSIVAAKSQEAKNNQFCNLFINLLGCTGGHCIAITSEQLEDLGIKIIELSTMIDIPLLRAGRLSDSQWIKLTQSIEQLRSSRAHVISSRDISLSTLSEICDDIGLAYVPIDTVLIDSTCLSIELQKILIKFSRDKTVLEPFYAICAAARIRLVIFILESAY